MKGRTCSQNVTVGEQSSSSPPKLGSCALEQDQSTLCSPKSIVMVSAIACRPQAFVQDVGERALLDMFVDSNNFEMKGSVRSLRFAAAAKIIGTLLEPEATAANFSSPISVHEVNAWEVQNGKKDSRTRNKEGVDENIESGGQTIGSMKTVARALDGAGSRAAPVGREVRDELMLSLSDRHGQGEDSFAFEPMTPPAARQGSSWEGYSARRVPPSSSWARRLLKKLSHPGYREPASIRIDGDEVLPDDDGLPPRRYHTLSNVRSRVERIFSRVSSSSRRGDPDIALTGAVNAEEPVIGGRTSTVRRGIKLRVKRWGSKAKKFFKRLLD